MSNKDTPLCVDLDGTILRTDSLHECILQLFRQNPLFLFLILFWWLFKGRAYCKHMIAQRVDIGSIPMPFNKALVEWLSEQKKIGRRLILVTGADQRIANTMSEKLQLFDEVIASDGVRNLKGKAKRDELIQRYGERNYDYVGDHKADLEVWAAARKAIVVSQDKQFAQKVEAIAKLEKVFTQEKATISIYLKCLRIHQYAKNILIFLPWILSHQFADITPLANCVLAFISFSLLASSVYVLNDLIDLPFDRTHRSKRFRPLASGLLSLPQGVMLFLGCFIVSSLIAGQLTADFLLVLTLYFAITLCYSFWLKQRLLIDVLVLSLLYTVRLFAGMVVANSVLSEWLLLFSIFLFTSLAFLKRYTELQVAKQDELCVIKGRGYRDNHIDSIKMFGVASGYISVLVLALYLNTAKALQLYHQPIYLFLACPVLIYWLSRMWLVAVDGSMHDDPVVFAVKDSVSYIVVILVFIIGAMATFG